MKKTKERKIKWFLVAVLVIITSSQFLIVLLGNYDKFFSRGYWSNYNQLEKSYYSSQYHDKNAKGFIPDEIFEEFAAGAFLKGMNPINIVHDHPPLGRYILSLSIILFDNAKTITIFCLITSIIGVYLIAKLVTKNVYLSFIPVIIFANEPLFINKLIYAPLPEPVHLPFIIFSIYIFLLSINKKNKAVYYILVSILLGFVVSIRFFVTGFLLIFSMGLFLTIYTRKIKDVLRFIVFLPLILIVLMLTYTRTMIDGYSPLQILGVQKYILAYHKSAFVNAFSSWDLILFNRWHTWWGNNAIISDPHWIVSWPMSVILTFTGIIVGIFRRIKLSPEEIFLCIWVTGYCLMLSAGYTSTRYFLPLLPFLYILAVSFTVKLFKIIKND